MPFIAGHVLSTFNTQHSLTLKPFLVLSQSAGRENEQMDINWSDWHHHPWSLPEPVAQKEILSVNFALIFVKVINISCYFMLHSLCTVAIKWLLNRTTLRLHTCGHCKQTPQCSFTSNMHFKWPCNFHMNVWNVDQTCEVWTLYCTSCWLTAGCWMGVTLGGGDSGTILGGEGFTRDASGEGFGAGIKRDEGVREVAFWTTEVVGRGGFVVVDLGSGVMPGDRDKGKDLEDGVKPATGERDGLEWGNMEDAAAEPLAAMLVGFTATTGDLTLCVTGPELVSLWLTSCCFIVVSSSLWSSLFSSCSTCSPFFSLFLSNSFSGRSSLRTRGRGSLVLPLTMRFVRPREMSSFSSILITSCLKENLDIMGALDAAAGAAFTGSAAGLVACRDLSDGCVGRGVSSSSGGRTFLTTRRTTFTTFLRVRPWSSVASTWLVLVPGCLMLLLAEPLTTLLPMIPFCSRSLFIAGSVFREACGVSRLLDCSPVLNGDSRRAGTLTGVLNLEGEGLLTRPTDSGGENGGGLFAPNNPLPGSRAGTDWARVGSPSLSDYS